MNAMSNIIPMKGNFLEAKYKLDTITPITYYHKMWYFHFALSDDIVVNSKLQTTLLVLFSSQFNSSWVPLKESILYNFTRTKFVLTSAASASAASNKYHDCAGKALAVVGFKPLHRQCTVRLWRAICTCLLYTSPSPRDS